MALATTPLPYGLRDIKITPYTTDAADTLGTAVDLPYVQTLSFSEAEDFEELRGDDKIVTMRGSGPTVEWELEAGGISIEALKVLTGGTIATTGTSPNAVKTFTKKVTDARGWFQIEGQVISDSGGDMHCVIFKCRTTDSVEGEFADGSFFMTKCKGQAIASTKTGATDELYKFVQNETTAAIV
jgi:hypothetical protein